MTNLLHKSNKKVRKHEGPFSNKAHGRVVKASEGEKKPKKNRRDPLLPTSIRMPKKHVSRKFINQSHT